MRHLQRALDREHFSVLGLLELWGWMCTTPALNNIFILTCRPAVPCRIIHQHQQLQGELLAKRPLSAF